MYTFVYFVGWARLLLKNIFISICAIVKFICQVWVSSVPLINLTYHVFPFMTEEERICVCVFVKENISDILCEFTTPCLPPYYNQHIVDYFSRSSNKNIKKKYGSVCQRTSSSCIFIYPACGIFAEKFDLHFFALILISRSKSCF